MTRDMTKENKYAQAIPVLPELQYVTKQEQMKQNIFNTTLKRILKRITLEETKLSMLITTRQKKAISYQRKTENFTHIRYQISSDFSLPRHQQWQKIF